MPHSTHSFTLTHKTSYILPPTHSHFYTYTISSHFTALAHIHFFFSHSVQSCLNHNSIMRVSSIQFTPFMQSLTLVHKTFRIPMHSYPVTLHTHFLILHYITTFFLNPWHINLFQSKSHNMYSLQVTQSHFDYLYASFNIPFIKIHTCCLYHYTLKYTCICIHSFMHILCLNTRTKPYSIILLSFLKSCFPAYK